MKYTKLNRLMQISYINSVVQNVGPSNSVILLDSLQQIETDLMLPEDLESKYEILAIINRFGFLLTNSIRKLFLGWIS